MPPFLAYVPSHVLVIVIVLESRLRNSSSGVGYHFDPKCKDRLSINIDSKPSLYFGAEL